MNSLFKVLFYTFITVGAANESCFIEDNVNCNASRLKKYSKDANSKHLKYLNLIKEARDKYSPCNTTKCNCHTSVISNDLKVFDKGITKEMVENVKSKGTKYQIINHHLFRDKNCMFPARCSGIEHFLLKLLPKLPDMEFIVNTRDWPQIHKNYNLFGPVFSFSKTNDYYDIMYPTWSFWEGGPAISLYPTGIGRWDLHRELLGKVGNETPWDEKIPKGFFRGSRTSQERDPLVLLSREKPDLVDARYTKNQAWKSDADTLNQPPAAEVSFSEHCKYKYLFNFRGVAASFRFKHILLCKSLVFHVGRDWIEFFYPALKPWIHYVPVGVNAGEGELRELLNFARDNDEAAKVIADEGYNLIWNHLKLGDVTCYWRKLLRQYAALLTYKPEADRNFIEIK